MINEANYSKQVMARVTSILGHNAKKRISEETGETLTTVENVWYGKQYKKVVVDAIVRNYKKILKQHLNQFAS